MTLIWEASMEQRYLLKILKTEFSGMNFGFYGDDGLSCFENKSGPELEKKQKEDV